MEAKAVYRSEGLKGPSSRLQFLFPADRMRIRLELEDKWEGKREKRGVWCVEDQDEQRQKEQREKR